MHRVLGPSIVASLLLLFGCFDDIKSEFEPGLDELETNEAPKPGGVGNLSIVDGEEADYLWVHGRGVIAATPAEVWAATKVPDRLINKCQSDGQQVQTGVEEDYEFSFKVHYTVESFVTVEWDELWRYGTPGSEPEAPRIGVIRYQKVFGSDAITLLEGQIRVVQTGDPNRTEVQFVEHLDAIGGGIEAMTEQMQQRFAELEAAVDDASGPSCPED